MYCKYDLGRSLDKGRKVLIVAKCIVNEVEGVNGASYIGVLIVAKCIVNNFIEEIGEEALTVLIVAKCIVNIFIYPVF